MNHAPPSTDPAPAATLPTEAGDSRAGLVLEAVALRLRPTGKILFPPLSLRIAPGTTTTLLGPSGCGKSSLLRWLGGHLEDDFAASGRVLVNGSDRTDWPAEKRRIGMLFQDAGLFPHLSVAGNLAFGLQPRVRGRRQRRRVVEEALASAGLEGFADRDPATLSGGQQARVALLRTLLAEPEALLLDEPFAALDPERRAQIRAFVFARIEERGIPTLLVTHDPRDAPGPVRHLDRTGDPAGNARGGPNSPR